MKVKSDYQGFQDLVNRRHLRYFYHYTPIQNLPSILKYGLLSRQLMKAKHIKYFGCHGWGVKWKEMDEYICLGIAPPRGMIRQDEHDLVAIAVDPILCGYEGVYFSPLNSARKNILLEEILARFSVGALESLFCSSYGDKTHSLYAEIIVKDQIPKSLIKAIITPHSRLIPFALQWQSWVSIAPPILIKPDLF